MISFVIRALQVPGDKKSYQLAMSILKEIQSKTVPRGIGDSIARLTKFFGIEPCGGCEKRRQTLNRIFPYRNSITSITSDPVASSTKVDSSTKESLEKQPPIFAGSSRSSIWVPNHDFQNQMDLRTYRTDLIHAFESGNIEQDSFRFSYQNLQRSTWIYDAKLQKIMASTGGRRDPDSRSGPLDAEGRRRSERQSGGATQPAPTGATSTSFACGVDVTQKMIAAINSTKRTFARWNNKDKNTACKALTSWSTGSFAWDIIELHLQVTSDTLNKPFRPQCATSGANPPCGSSVTVQNSCHFAGSANYVIFGVMCRLCHSFYDNLLQQNSSNWDIFLDAVSDYSPRDILRMSRDEFSENGMLYLIDLYKKYIPLLSLDPVAGNINAAKSWSKAGFHGWPNARATPIGDRSNCTLTCGQQPSTPLRVSWYPFLNAYSR